MLIVALLLTIMLMMVILFILKVKNNEFIDNDYKNNPSSDKSIISSEVTDIFSKDDFLSNDFKNTDQNIYNPPIIYVDF